MVQLARHRSEARAFQNAMPTLSPRSRFGLTGMQIMRGQIIEIIAAFRFGFGACGGASHTLDAGSTPI